MRALAKFVKNNYNDGGSSEEEEKEGGDDCIDDKHTNKNNSGVGRRINNTTKVNLQRVTAKNNPKHYDTASYNVTPRQNELKEAHTILLQRRTKAIDLINYTQSHSISLQESIKETEVSATKKS